MNCLQYAAWLQDLEAQCQIIDAEPELANEVTEKEAKKCPGRTALMILCEGTAPQSETERAEWTETILAYLAATHRTQLVQVGLEEAGSLLFWPSPFAGKTNSLHLQTCHFGE